jgi:predicted RNA binding protein YcfA (HicA-like mRNA interferase family)
MTRGFFNWTAEDVIRILKNYNFLHIHTKGSHMFYVGRCGGELRQVCVPFHGSRILKPRTLKGIINQSGIPKEKWLKRD